MTKNVDIDRYKYLGYGIGFDRKGEFSFGNGFGRNVIIFGLNVSSCRKKNNSKKDSNYWRRSYKRIVTYRHCRKKVFN